MTLTPEQLATILKRFGAKPYKESIQNYYYELWLPIDHIDAYLSWLRILDYHNDKCNYRCCCEPSGKSKYFYIFYHQWPYERPQFYEHPDGVMFSCYYHADLIHQALQLITTE